MQVFFDGLVAKIQGTWKSWTIWVNGIILLIIQFADSLQITLPIVHEYLPSNLYQMLGIVAGINILLRFKTNKDLAAK